MPKYDLYGLYTGIPQIKSASAAGGVTSNTTEMRKVPAWSQGTVFVKIDTYDTVNAATQSAKLSSSIGRQRNITIDGSTATLGSKKKWNMDSSKDEWIYAAYGESGSKATGPGGGATSFVVKETKEDGGALVWSSTAEEYDNFVTHSVANPSEGPTWTEKRTMNPRDNKFKPKSLAAPNPPTN